MKKYIITLLLVLSIIAQPISTLAAISASYQTPSVTPPTTHPRVLFTSEDVAEIRERLENPGEQNDSAASMYRYRRDMTENDPHGGSDASEGHNYKRMASIEAKAFDYAITGNESNGRLAVDYIINYLNTLVFPSMGDTTLSRQSGHIIYVTGEVYDWCYDLMTADERNQIINLVETKLCSNLEIGWPPTDQGVVTGHGSESQLLRDLMSFAIATYNERPDIWNVVAGRFYQQYVPVRNKYNKAHYNLQGSGYGLYRHRYDSWAYLLITGMGAPAPYESTEDLYNVAYSQIYMRRPDGQYFRDGDEAWDSDYTNPFERWTHFGQVYMMDAAIGNDPFLKNEWIRNNPTLDSYYEDSTILQLIINKDSLKPKSFENLPLSRFFDAPAGIMTARTSWEEGEDSTAVVAEMKIGGDVVNNHQHLDAGHFQLYYKGILASDSGMYQGADDGQSDYDDDHHKFYSTKTIAHNSMLVYNPDEVSWIESMMSGRGTCLDGGQKAINSASEYSTNPSDNTVATVLNKEIDRKNPNKPSYTYIKGDLKNAYSNKVSDYKRSFMFLNLGREDVPAALIVLDNITSSDASYKKTWLLHGQEEEPIVDGTKTTFTNTYSDENGAYNGKMIVNTLLPANPTISKVGGEGNWSYVQGKANENYEAGESDTPVDEGNGWRIEVSPSSSAATDTFLNILQVSDADKNYYIEPTKIESGDVVGVQIADRVVTFAKNGGEVASDVVLTAAGGSNEYTLCDMKAGTWTVSNGSASKTYQTTADGKVLNFIDDSAQGTQLTVTYTNSTAAENPAAPDATDIDYLKLYNIDEEYETANAPRLDGNGSPLVAASDIADMYGLVLNETENSVTLSKSGRSYTENDSVIDGVSYVNLDGVIEVFGGSYEVDETYLELHVTPGSGVYALQIYVSSDGVDYEAVDMSKFTANDWIIKQNDGWTNGKWYAESYGNTNNMVAYPIEGITQFAYVYADVPDGATLDMYTGFCMDSGITPLEPWREEPFNYVNEQIPARVHTALPVKTAAKGTRNDPVKIPLRLGRPAIVFNYTPEEDAEKEIYGMRLLSGWATAAMNAELTNMHDIFKIWDDYSGSEAGMPMLMNGASVGNDNQTVLDTYTYARPKNGRQKWSQDKLWVGAHFSKWLEGSSYVMMPIWGLSWVYNEEQAVLTNPDTKFFDIQTQEDYSWTANYYEKYDTSWTEEGEGYDGEVVVLMATPAAEGSKYLDSTSGWECVNNGTAANGISTANATFSARDKNTYTNTDYYATAIRWKASGLYSGTSGWSFSDMDSFMDTNNAYRAIKAGIRGSMEGAWDTATKLTYAYRYKFKAGEAIPIWNPCNITTDYEKDIMMVPIIKYYTPEETLDMSIDDGVVTAKGKMKNTSDSSKTGTLMIAQYGSDKMLVKADVRDVYTVNPDTTEYETFKLETPVSEDASYAKAFLWDNVQNMKAYVDSVKEDIK